MSYAAYDMSTRINARIDPVLAGKIEAIRRQTGMTITEIVEAALVAWTTEGLATKSTPMNAFSAAGFVGSADGPKHLARDAKHVLRQTLKSKT